MNFSILRHCRLLSYILSIVFIAMSSPAIAGVSLVFDDDQTTSNKDTVSFSASDTIMIRLYVTGADSLHSFGVEIYDSLGALEWVVESAATIYKTPAAWTKVDPVYDPGTRSLVLQASDFGLSTSIQPPYEIAQLHFVMEPGDSCGLLTYVDSTSGWFNGDVGDSGFTDVTQIQACVSSVLDPGDPSPSGEGLSESFIRLVGSQAGEKFGTSVAPAGDVNGDGLSDLLVGSPEYSDGQTNEGKATLYLGSAQDSIEREPVWEFESNVTNADFGAWVSPGGDINGDGYHDILVGAPGYSDGTYSGRGRAYVFYGGASGPSTSADTILEGNAANAAFGSSGGWLGDIDGDGYSDFAVGAPYWTNGQTNEGLVSVWLGSETIPEHDIDIESNSASALFGWSIASAGDIDADGDPDMVVGMPGYSNAASNEGAARLFLGTSTGMSSSHTWHYESDQANAELGSSVGSAGDVDGDGYADVVIGSHKYDTGSIDAGKVRIFLGSSSGLPSTPDWSKNGESASDEFSTSVQTAGDVNGDGYADIVLGAPLDDGEGTNVGKASIFLGGASVSTTEAWSATGTQDNAELSSLVSGVGDLNGDGFGDVAIAAPKADYRASDPGIVYVFFGESLKPSSSNDWEKESDQAGANFGKRLSSAGDLDGDGYTDFAVSAYLYDNSGSNKGRVTVYLGDEDGPGGYDEVVYGENAGDRFGRAVARVEDTNSDGETELAIGAPELDLTTGSNHGAAYLYGYNGSSFGQEWKTTGVDLDPNKLSESEAAGAKYGFAIVSPGDLNGDGSPDLAVSAPGHDNGTGCVAIFLGDPTGLSTTSATHILGADEGDSLGYSLAGGHLEDNVFGDLVIGTPYTANGRIDVFHGKSTGFPIQGVGGASGVSAGDEFGYSVALIPGLRGQYDSEELFNRSMLIAVGAPGRSSNAGSVYIRYYSGASLEEISSPDAGANRFGHSVAYAGDVNGDGFGDLIVGAPDYDDGALEDAGRAYIFLGDGEEEGGVLSSPFWTMEIEQAGARFGWYVASAGDVNGDGFGDVLVGAPGYDNGQSNEGKASLYYGNEGGLSRASVVTTDDAGDQYLALHGTDNISEAASDNDVGFDARTFSASGRERVQLRVEIIKGGEQIVSSKESELTLTDAPTAGSYSFKDQSLAFFGLHPSSRYSWRARTLSSNPYFYGGAWVTNPFETFGRGMFQSGPTSVDVEGGVLSARNSLHAYPNPFNPTISIRYSVPARTKVELAVYSITGRLVRQLESREVEAGTHTYAWTARDAQDKRVASGIYFIRLRVDGTTYTEKTTLLR